jgi:tetratricopeptide (TPR) repeat protein
MEVEVLDAGFKRLPGNRFIQGEDIILTAKIVNYTALNQKDEFDKELARMAKESVLPSKSDMDVRIDPVILGSDDAPWTEAIAFWWIIPGQSGDKMAGATRATFDSKPDLLGRGTPKNELFFEQTEFWTIATSSVNVGEKNLIAIFQVPDKSLPDEAALLEQTVEFTIVDPAEVSPSEFARVTLYKADDALNAESYDEAIALAREAIDYGPEDPFDLATLHEFVGTAFEAKGDLDSALTAYEQVLSLAEQYFPGRSSTEARMLPTIERLRQLIESKE